MATSVDIKDIQGNIVLSTPINDGSKRKFTLQKEDYVTLKFSLDDPIYFKLGYWIDTDFGLFELVDLYKPNYNQSTAGYDYELRLDAYYWKWKNKKLKYSPENAAKETSFSLTATLDVHAGIVLRNLSALGYKYRGVDFTFSIDSTVENKPFLMTYDNINILDACFQMANSAGCECWVTDNIIHFGRCEFGDPVDFELGVNVDTMKRSDSQTEYSTRIIAFGSTRNIPTNYRPTDDSMIVGGVVQKRLMLPVGTSYVDAYENMTEEEAVEDVVVFDDVYPRRIGTMSGVTTKQYTDKTENEDGTTTSEVWNAYRFKDSITFSKDYVISGQDLKIKFESGLLNGMEFGVTFNPDGKPEKINGVWNPEAQIWEIVRNSDYGINLPNDTLKPANGDTFVLSGFDTTFVSDTYIPLAEQELLQKAQEYVAKTKIDPSTYDNKMMSGGALYEVGDRVNLINPGYFENGRVSRIIGFEYNLDIPTDSPIYTVGETAAYSRIGDIEEKLENITYKSQTYTGAGGSGVYVIRLNDSTTASNSNVFSSLRQLAMFLRKDIPNSAAELITFLHGLKSGGNIEVGDFVSGMLTGKGGRIDAQGNAEFQSAVIRGSMKVMELLINRLYAIESDYVYTEADTVEEVEEVGEKTYRLTLRRKYDGYFTAQKENNVLFGVINSLANGSGGEYYTAWSRVLSVNTTDNTITVVMYPDNEVPDGVNYPPTKGMVLARKGSSDSPLDGSHNERQDFWSMSSSDGRLLFLQNVAKPILEEYYYTLSIGKLPELEKFKALPIGKDDTAVYAKNIVAENYYQIDASGNVQTQEVYRGAWSADVAASDQPYRRIVNDVTTPTGATSHVLAVHTVYHRGCKWACLTDMTTLEPKWNSPAWQFLEGDSNYSIRFSAYPSERVRINAVNMVITARVYYGNLDITDEMLALPGTDIQWTRNSGIIPEDNAWHPALGATKNILNITNQDMATNWLAVQKVGFVITVFIPTGDGTYYQASDELPLTI